MFIEASLLEWCEQMLIGQSQLILFQCRRIPNQDLPKHTQLELTLDNQSYLQSTSPEQKFKKKEGKNFILRRKLSSVFTSSRLYAASLGATCSPISDIFSAKTFLSSVFSIDEIGVPRT